MQTATQGIVRWVNLSLLLLYPVAWAAPLMQAGLLPLFGLEKISVLTGLRSLWATDIFLALMVTLFALIAPYAKTIGLALVHFGRAGTHLLPVLSFLGKLAMADIFLIALYITVIKGIGVGRVETLWGLYLFSLCILGSIWCSSVTKRDKTK